MAWPPDPLVGFSFNLPPTGEVDYLRHLTPVTSDVYNTLTAKHQRNAFTISGVGDGHIIRLIRDKLAEVVQRGGTQADFGKVVRQITNEAGVEGIEASTLDSVFIRTVHEAYSAQRHKQMTDPAVLIALPFWQYLTVGDDRVRPSHAILDKFTALAADPVWKRIYPPRGRSCRCIVIPLLASEAPDDASEDGMTRLKLLRGKLPRKRK